MNRIKTASGTFQVLLFTFVALFMAAAPNASAAQEKLIKITPRKENGRTVFSIRNLTEAPVTVTLEMKLDNLTPSLPVPFTTTLSGHETNSVLTLSPADAARDTSWSYTYFATWGSLAVKHDDSTVYMLPFAPGKSFSVSQGYHGEFSHTGCDEYAIDWKMPIGTPVHAARDGIVVAIKDDSQSGGGDKKFEWDANYVLVRHADGTLGHYVHLMKGGVKVKVGQAIRAGDWIALSGNTGRSTGPHLHFAVFKAHDGKARETIPVKFQTAEAVLATLQQGTAYRAL